MKDLRFNSEKSWLSVYLFYGDSLNMFLVKAVLPFINRVCEFKLVDKFFFIRYYDRGPHIRLRLLTNSTNIEKLKVNLFSHFLEYMNLNPSQRIEPENSHLWYSNNSIQLFDYEPEVERYGGIDVLPHCETYFQASSVAALKALANDQNWSYSRSLGTALQMHIGFMWASGIEISNFKFLFSNILESWVHRAFPYFKALEENSSSRQLALDSFELSYKQQSSTLIPYISSIWTGLKAGELWEESWFNEWLTFNSEICSELNELKMNGYLVVPDFYYKKSIADFNNPLFYLYESFIHMTNNRLGIANHDEGFIAFVLIKSLDSF